MIFRWLARNEKIRMDKIFPEMQKNKKYHISEYDGHLNGLATDAPAGLPVKKIRDAG
jgi:hypothetical protein